MVQRLEGEARREALQRVKLWSQSAERDAIWRRFAFASFSEAFAWMTRVAMVAEKLDHHPEWTNVYNVVTIVLTTHDAKGLSARDIELAAAIDRLTAG